MNPVKIAVIGAGNMAREHLKAFAHVGGVTLTGIYSRTRSRAEEVAADYPGMEVCNSVEELYQRTGADLVIVTVRELSMAAVAAEAFCFPWKVLLEKPAGYDLADAKRIVDAAAGREGEVFVALNRRAYGSTRNALSALAGCDAPRFVKVLDQQDQAAARDIYGEPPEVVKNYMFANSIHLIDYFHVFGRGEITDVTSVVPWTPEQPGMVVASIRFSSGDIGLYEGCWDGPGPWMVTVTHRELRAEMRPLEQLTLQRRGERKLVSVDGDPLDTALKPGLGWQARQALAAVRGEAHSLPTLADSWKSMVLVAKIFGLGA
ncbi:MAG: Gfo/Idh/MocA family oxidoreductase [Rhodocyclaceae bacterium]|nr:MAG: Gfo/Idh/MocA family oxidoreductase [Rhodocyclaceae bacterium]